MENDIRRNGSGYVDPTAYKAIRNATKEERKREVDPEERLIRNRDSTTFSQPSLLFVICRIFILRNVSL